MERWENPLLLNPFAHEILVVDIFDALILLSTSQVNQLLNDTWTADSGAK